MEKSSFVYCDHSVLYNTAKLMSGGTIAVPEDYRKLIESAYLEPSIDSPFYENHCEYQESVLGSTASFRRVILEPDQCYGCSLAEDFIDNQWDAVERAITRESDDRTVQCILLEMDEDKLVPLSGNPETSIITLKRKIVGDEEPDGIYDYGKWKYIRKVVMEKRTDSDGQSYRSMDGRLKYTKEKGAEYV